MTARFTIPGQPVAWARARRNGRTSFTAPGYQAWLDVAVPVLLGAWRRPSLRVPVSVRVVAVFKRPTRPPSWQLAGQRMAYPWEWGPGRCPRLGAADVDNLAKAALDALQAPCARKGQPLGRPVLADDRLVWRLECSRWYAAVGESPRVEIDVEVKGA